MRKVVKHTSTVQHIVPVKLGERSYDIVIGDGILTQSGELVSRVFGDSSGRLAVVSNKKVFSHYGSGLVESLRRSGFTVSVHLIGDGEKYKSLRTAEKLFVELIELRLDRDSAIVALGGGVVGDLAGFVAATFQRGISYIQIPTTLVAAIDSSVGGKTAVNLPQGKNLVGAFHQPRVVITDVEVLRTLPRREVIAGLCEAIKYGVIRDPTLFEFIAGNIGAIKNLETGALTHLIRRSCEIKAEVVEQDERESGVRQILNFGHTFGHALETATSYRRLKHGEAVGYGMIMASRLSVELGMLNPADGDRIREVVAACGRFPAIADLDSRKIAELMVYDKKVKGGKLTLILPVKIGEVELRRDVPEKLIGQVIRLSLKG
jgi:3-dehydroquinate synthase